MPEMIPIPKDPPGVISPNIRLSDGPNTPPVGPPAFGKFIIEEAEKWGKVIRASNIKLE